MSSRSPCIFAFLALVASGCSGSGADETPKCDVGLERYQGRCVDPSRRYEPETQLDLDNVAVYGAMPVSLDLPPPPKSGFRLVVPPQKLAPGEELSGCVSWKYPALTHRNVYAARIYTTPGLHHSNLYGMPYNKTVGPSSYPACALGQNDPFAHATELLGGNIPDVLFANSTQILGGEGVTFQPGMAFAITTAEREVATSIHWINPGNEETTVETVYDFFTVADEFVTTPLAPYYFDNYDFAIPPHEVGQVQTTCQVYGGNLVSLMPHTHKRTTDFSVDLLGTDGSERRLYDAGGYNLESDIHLFDDPVSLTGVAQVRFTCTVNNDLSVPIHYGIGQNEMCTLFGYMYPPSVQTIGIVQQGTYCLSLNIGGNR